MVTSPSLFAEDKVVVVDGLERAGEELLDDVTAYLAAPPAEVVLVLRHGGGQRGKKLLDALRAAGVPTVACDVIKSDGDKTAFVTAELRRAGRRADAQAVRALVDAVGSDLRELAASCAQLVADTTGLIGPEAVERYYGGRIEATGFRWLTPPSRGRRGRRWHCCGTRWRPVSTRCPWSRRSRRSCGCWPRSPPCGAAGPARSGTWASPRGRRTVRWRTCADGRPKGWPAPSPRSPRRTRRSRARAAIPQFAVERAVLRVAAAVGS